MKKINKKMFLTVLVAFTMVVLAACGSDSGGESKSDGQDKLEQIKEKGELTIGTSPDFPPMEFYILDENGDRKIVGSDIVLAEKIAEEIGVDLKITATDFDGVIANIQAGAIDFGISGFTFTEEREKIMQFSEGYSQESSLGFQGIMTTKEMAEEFDTLEEFIDADLKLGAQGGSIQYEMAQGLTSPANIKQFGTLDVSLLELNAGNIDAVLVSTSSAEPMLDKFDNLVILPQESFDLDPERKYSQNMIGFPLGEEYESLIEVVDEVIKEVVESGDFTKWQDEARELSSQAVEE